ncbi:MAG: hypothetical protein K0U72_13410 [Gammaproteobacteria bacterium]|nr:hypothetical protein [Gammaproteobacteria bacterium]
MIDRKQARQWPVLVLAVCGSGCGGSGGEGPIVPPAAQPPVVTTESGRLIDGPVSSIEFRSGEASGTTDSGGVFRYESVDGVSQVTDFSFGGIEIGSTVGRPIITPLDFVPRSNINSLAVLNISRFLQMLDSDDDLSNGIAPSVDLTAAVNGMTWGPIDFADNDFANQPAVADLVSFINSVDSVLHSLPTPEAARDHLRESLACLSSGIYHGRFSGDDSGQFVMLLQHLRADPSQFGNEIPRPGVASALVYSEIQNRLIGVLPRQSLGFDANQSFIVGETTNGAQFSGSLANYDRLTGGEWRNDVEGGVGTFDGERVAGDFSAVFRLAGAFGDDTPFDVGDDTADNRGGLALDVFADNRVSGVMVSARGDVVSLSGTLEGETILATSTDSGSIEITLDTDGTNPLNTVAGLFGVPGFWGSWQHAGLSGVLGGTSCKLQ